MSKGSVVLSGSPICDEVINFAKTIIYAKGYTADDVKFVSRKQTDQVLVITKRDLKW